MTWTKTVPTESGWYWIEHPAWWTGEPKRVISMLHHNLDGTWTGYWEDEVRMLEAAIRWAGPIPEPDEAPEAKETKDAR